MAFFQCLEQFPSYHSGSLGIKGKINTFLEERISERAERFKIYRCIYITLNTHDIISGVSYKPQERNIPYPVITGTSLAESRGTTERQWPGVVRD